MTSPIPEYKASNEVPNYCTDTAHNYGFEDHSPALASWYSNYARTSHPQQIRYWTGITTITSTSRSKIKTGARLGIPANRRAQVWYECLQAFLRKKLKSDTKIKISPRTSTSPPSPTSTCMTLAAQSILQPESIPSSSLPASTTLIDKDVDRTFVNHPFYRLPSTHTSLRRILYSYAVRHPHLGYCQGMNSIFGILLLFYNEQQALTFGTLLLDSFLPSDYYSTSLLGVTIDVHVLIDMLANKYIKLYWHLQENNIDLVSICTSWFLTLYVKTLPIETVFRVWDALFVEGPKILFRVALALFVIHYDALMQECNMGKLHNMICTMGSQMYDAEGLLKVAFKKIGPVKRAEIAKRREIHRWTLTEQVTAREQQQKMNEDKLYDPDASFADDMDTNGQPHPRDQAHAMAQAQAQAQALKQQRKEGESENGMHVDVDPSISTSTSTSTSGEQSHSPSATLSSTSTTEPTPTPTPSSTVVSVS